MILAPSSTFGARLLDTFESRSGTRWHGMSPPVHAIVSSVSLPAMIRLALVDLEDRPPYQHHTGNGRKSSFGWILGLGQSVLSRLRAETA